MTARTPSRFTFLVLLPLLALPAAAAPSVIWTDPDFDAGNPAFYYVRVLEIPTPIHYRPHRVVQGPTSP